MPVIGFDLCDLDIQLKIRADTTVSQKLILLYSFPREQRKYTCVTFGYVKKKIKKLENVFAHVLEIKGDNCTIS